MLLGYARVSTEDQKLDLQHDALLRAGCEKIFDETVSGTALRLPVRQELLDFARPADTVVVFKLDRLGRSLRDLIELVNAPSERGVGLRSLRESIDTTTPAAKLTFHVFCTLADSKEMSYANEPTPACSPPASAARPPGSPRSLSPAQVEMARTLLANPNLSTRQVAAQLGVHGATLYRSLAETR